MPPRTSSTHPLRIDELPVPGTPGRLGLTICPGKHQPRAASGAWARDLDVDLRAIAAWGATLLLNLIEDHEMQALRVADMAQRLPAGLAMLRLPIPDAGVPSAAWEQGWAEAGPAVQRSLERGERVLVHCKGGLGRTGLVAARILVDAGVAPALAVRRVRAARPGAIETAEQLAYVLALRA